MTNLYAGPCRTCAQWVEKGQGVYTPATKMLVHSQCAPVAPVAPVAAGKLIINSLAEWERHCGKLMNASDLEGAYKFLMDGARVYAGRHAFKQQGLMKDATDMIHERAKALPVTRYSFGYRDTKPPMMAVNPI